MTELRKELPKTISTRMSRAFLLPTATSTATLNTFDCPAEAKNAAPDRPVAMRVA